MPQNFRPEPEPAKKGVTKVRVLLSTYGSRGGVEPLGALAARLRALGAEARRCAPPDDDFARRSAGVGVPLVLDVAGRERPPAYARTAQARRA